MSEKKNLIYFVIALRVEKERCYNPCENVATFCK